MKINIKTIMDKTSVFFSKHFFFGVLISFCMLLISIPTVIGMVLMLIALFSLFLSRHGHSPLSRDLSWEIIKRRYDYEEDAEKEYKRVHLKIACRLFWLGTIVTLFCWIAIGAYFLVSFVS